MERCTPEYRSTWDGYLKAQPERVLDALKIPSPDSEPNKWGDTYANVYPAMTTIFWAAKQSRLRPYLPLFVESGLVDVVCKIAVDEGHRTCFLRQAEEKGHMPLGPTWYYTLVILWGVAQNLESPLSVTDRMFITALKRNWSDLASKIWEDPGNTMREAENSSLERAVIGMVVVSVMNVDSSFLSIIDNDMDLTISVLVRNVLHLPPYRDDVHLRADFNLLANTLLCEIISPIGGSMTQYYRADNPVPQASALRRIVKGCGDEGSLNPLYDKIALIMSALRFEGVRIFASFLDSIAQTVRQIPIHYNAFLRHAGLWVAILRALREDVGGYPAVLSGEDPTQLRTFMLAVGLILYGLKDGRERAWGEFVAFAGVLVNAGIFEFLEGLWRSHDTHRPARDTTNGLAISTKLLCDMLYQALVCSESLPSETSLCPLYRLHLPRPHLLHALLEVAFFPNGTFQASPMMPEMASLEEIAIHTNYLNLDRVQRACAIDGNCNRRGCSNAAKSRCSACKETAYCGSDCQVKDWDEHRTVCCSRFTIWVEPTTGETFDEISLPRQLNRRARVGVLRRIAFPLGDEDDEGGDIE